MNQQKIPSFLLVFFICLVITACNNSAKPATKKIVVNPENMDQETTASIQQALQYALQNKGEIDDSTHLKMLPVVNEFYSQTKFANIWSHKEKWEPLADTLMNFIKACETYGLFPKDYQFKKLVVLKTMLETDSLKRMDAEIWTRADLLLTDGFMHVIKDLKVGRLMADSILFNKKDTVTKKDFYTASLKTLIANKQFTNLLNTIEPSQQGYQALKNLLPQFLDSMDRKVYTYVPFPFKANDVKDSVFFVKKIEQRLKESDCIAKDVKMADSVQLSAAIKKFQKKKAIKTDGKVSAGLVRLMNLNDLERFKRIAITLDRYKQLPPTMPEKYIWVNLPSYYLQVIDHDSVVITSKIIVGKPDTKTPLLYSVISDMVTYPTWTVPNSIIKKNYLPKLKSNPYYLSHIGLHLENNKGETIDPGTVNWSKYTKGIPFKVMQGSGDDNALGILKFNFNNPYSVYLHDTNQRYLFSNSSRALSHGCVRVQQWEELAFFIARNDSMNVKAGDSLRYNTDSIKNWLANKERKRIGVKHGIPLFIVYFSCEAKGNKIKFYEDMYGDDKLMREKYFSDK